MIIINEKGFFNFVRTFLTGLCRLRQSIFLIIINMLNTISIYTTRQICSTQFPRLGLGELSQGDFAGK
jgi:hypothetical protein